MAEPQTTTEYNPLGKLLGVLALLAAGLYFTGWTYRWTYFSFFQLEVTTLNLPGESFYLAAFQTFFGEPLAFLRTILVLGVTVFAILVTLHWGQKWGSKYLRRLPFRDLRFDNVPFGRTQFAPTLWTKSVTVGAQSLRPPIDWDIIPTQVPYFQ